MNVESSLKHLLKDATLDDMNNINYLYDLVNKTKHLINHTEPINNLENYYLINIVHNTQNIKTSLDKRNFKSNLDYENNCIIYDKHVELKMNRQIFNKILTSDLDTRKLLMFATLLTASKNKAKSDFIKTQREKNNLYNKKVKSFNENIKNKDKPKREFKSNDFEVGNIPFTTGQAYFNSVISSKYYCKYKTWFEDNNIIINIPLTDKIVENTSTNNTKKNRHSHISGQCEKWYMNEDYLTTDTITTNYAKFFDTFLKRTAKKDKDYYKIDKLDSILPNDAKYLTILLTKRYELKYKNEDLTKKLKTIPSQIENFIDIVYNKNIIHIKTDKSGRKHSQLTRICKLFRSSLLYKKHSIAEFDLKAAQPAIAGNLAFKHYSEFDFDNYFNTKQENLNNLIDLEDNQDITQNSQLDLYERQSFHLTEFKNKVKSIKSTLNENFKEFKRVIKSDIYEDARLFINTRNDTNLTRNDVKLKMLPFFMDSIKRQLKNNNDICIYFKTKFPFIYTWLKFIQSGKNSYKNSSKLLQKGESDIIFKKLIPAIHKYKADHNFKTPNIIFTVHDAIYLDDDSMDIFKRILNKTLTDLGYCSKLELNKIEYKKYKKGVIK